MKNQEELRLYSFNHYKLTGIHAGIQCQHATQEMNLKYKEFVNSMFHSWAEDWKTTVILNGGPSSNLHRLKDLMSQKDFPFFWGCFHESEEDMEGLLTNICVILPKSVFTFYTDLSERDKFFNNISEESKSFYITMNEEVSPCRLMN